MISNGYVEAVAVIPAPAPAKKRMKALQILLPNSFERDRKLMPV